MRLIKMRPPTKQLNSVNNNNNNKKSKVTLKKWWEMWQPTLTASCPVLSLTSWVKRRHPMTWLHKPPAEWFANTKMNRQDPPQPHSLKNRSANKTRAVWSVYVRLCPCIITTTKLRNNIRREKSHQHNMCQFHHVFKYNLHVIPLFPDTHPDTWLGALRKWLLPHRWSGHVGHNCGSTIQ